MAGSTTRGDVTLELRDVSVAYATAEPLLRDVNVTLTRGFYGLVGANGAGKTTLLAVLAREECDVKVSGTIRARSPSGDPLIVRCTQTVNDVSDDVRSLAAASDGAAWDKKGRLSLDPDAIERWTTLSPGERKRWQIAAALYRDPDVLLLDEPTNHLDATARDELFALLVRFRGLGIIVSHDRAVLEQLPRAILRISDRDLTMYRGAYSEAKAAWELEREEREARYARAKASVRALERRLDDARRTQAATTQAMSARARMKDKNDHDGRSVNRKVVASWADARAGRTVEVLHSGIERARASVPTIERDRTSGAAVFARLAEGSRTGHAPTSILFHVDADEIRPSPSGPVILRDVRLTIHRDDRLRIEGPNGAGKTTLISHLMRGGPLRSGEGDELVVHPRVLFVPQEISTASRDLLVEHLHSLDSEERGRTLSIFSALGSDPESLVRRSTADRSSLSPGEARKLALAIGLGQHVWALVLDEPTNHLDLPTVERLEDALARYPGCVVLVTHDDAFAKATTTRSMAINPETKTLT